MARQSVRHIADPARRATVSAGPAHRVGRAGGAAAQIALIGYLSILQPGMFALGLALALLSRSGRARPPQGR